MRPGISVPGQLTLSLTTKVLKITVFALYAHDKSTHGLTSTRNPMGSTPLRLSGQLVQPILTGF